MSDIIIEVQMVYSIHLLIRNKKLSVIIFREFQTVDKVFGFLSRILRYCSMMKKKKKSKKAIGLAIKILMYSTVFV